MKTMILMFFLLLMTIADSNQDGDLDPHQDQTEYYINEIFVIIQTFDVSKLRDLVDGWISQHDKSKTQEMPSVIIDSSNVTFSKFISDEDFIPTSTIRGMECMFDDSLDIRFRRRSVPSILEGIVQYQDSVNFSSCQIPFHLNISTSIGNIHNYNQQLSDKIISWSYDPSLLQEMSTVTGSTEFCQSLSEYRSDQQKDILKQLVSEAFSNATQERYQPLFESLYQGMTNRCLNSKSGINATKTDERNDYVHLKPIRKLVGIPWISDYNELIIKGMGNLLSAKIENENQCKFDVSRVEIRWNIVSLASQQYHIEAYGFSIHVNKSNVVDSLRVDFLNAFKVTSFNEEPLDTNVQENLKKLIANGIKETYLKITSVTKDFTDTIRKILQPFNKNPFKNTLVDFEIAEIFLSFSNIEIEAPHIGNVTCVDKNLNVSTIRYKKILGQAEYWYSAEKSNVFHSLVSANVTLKEVEIHILLKPHPNSPNEVQTDDNLNITDTTIMIESNNNRLRKEERLSIGTEILKRFVDAFRENIIKITKSTFHPIFNICRNLQESTDLPQTNHFTDRNRYFAVIRNFWMSNVNPFSTRQIDLTVHGSWNFKRINLRYENESVIIDGLRIENVSGNLSMRQIDDSNETQTCNYSMNYFSLVINHSDYDIQVQVPPHSEYRIDCVFSNISMSAQNKDDIIENFQLIVASYIEQSIYNDSDYRNARFRKAREKFLDSVQEEGPLKYDASPKLSFWLFKALLKWHIELRRLTYEYYRGWDSSKGYRLHEKVINIFPAIIREEICDNFNHSTGDHMCTTLELTTSKSSEIGIMYNLISMETLIKMKKRCVMDTSIDNEGIQFHVDPESIQVNSSQNNTADKTKLVNLTLSLFEEELPRYNRLPACKSSFDALTLSEKHFYLIEDNITQSQGSFLTYHIRLYGLNNLKSFYNEITYDYSKFELTITNLTAHIIWIQNIGGLPSEIPEKMILKIGKITLTGETTARDKNRRLIFTNGTQIQISDRKDPRTAEKLTETLGSIILKSIKQSLRNIYYRIMNTYEEPDDLPDSDPEPDLPKGHFL